MVDNAAKTIVTGRRQVTDDDRCATTRLSNKHGISMELAWALIEQYGADSATLEAAAHKLSG